MKSLAVAWLQTGDTFTQGTTTNTVPGNTAIESDANSNRFSVPTGRYRNLRTRVSANGVSASSTIHLEDDGSATALSVSYAAAETGDKLDTDSVTVDADSLVHYECAAGAGGTTLTVTLIAIQFEPDDGRAATLFASKTAGSTNLSVASTTTFFALTGARGSTTTESTRSVLVPVAANPWSDLHVRVGTCARTTDVIARSRINGADGNQTVTMAGPTDATDYHDASNEDSFAANDLVNYSITTGTGTGNFNIEHLTSTMISSAGFSYMALSGNSIRINPNLTRFWPLGGSLTSAEEATESAVAVVTGFDFGWQLFTIEVDRNLSVVPTYRSRINTANGNQVLAFSASEVATKTDGSNEDAVAETDSIDYQVSSPAGGTNFDTALVGSIADVSPELYPWQRVSSSQQARLRR